jgi:predicted ATP-grasp superfamily ATP-dependent carboligase
MMTSVLVLSGHVVSLAIARSLAEANIDVFVASYDRRDMAPLSRCVRRTIHVPHPEISEVSFINTILEFGRTHDRVMLIPGDDASLVATAMNYDRLAEVFLMACPAPEVVKRVVDKRTTYALAAAAAVAVPLTIAPKSARETADAADSIGYPCLVKPSTSHRYFEVFGAKYRRVFTREAAEAAFVEAQRAGIDVMVQELVTGGDECGVNYNAYMVDGKPRVEFTARKIRMVPPGGGVPGAVISEHIRDVVDPGRRALSAVGLEGYACVEFKWDSSSRVYKLLEINGRHNRSTLLATSCGINFPRIDYEYRTTGLLPAAQHFEAGRYWLDEFKDLSYFPTRLRMNPASGLGFWRPYLWFPVCAVFDWRDPYPFLGRVSHAVGLLRRRLQFKHTLERNRSEARTLSNR